MRDGLRLLLGRVIAVLGGAGGASPRARRELPCLGYTHFQPAQLTTVGKRATLWMQDLALDVEELGHRLETLRLRGCKGTTGTQASFLELFDGDHDKVRELERRVTAKLGFAGPFAVTGQTYPRKVDAQVLDALAGIAQSAAKLAATSGCCSTRASCTSRSRRSRSAPAPWPTSGTRCAPSGSAAWRGS